MKIAIVSYGDPEAVRVRKIMLNRLAKTDIQCEPKHPDIVISIGGDGTLLTAFNKYQDQLDHVRFVGIHTGHLGFYTDWRNFEVDDLLTSLQHDSGQSVAYPLLQIDVTYSDGQAQHMVALNESALRQKTKTMVSDVYINDRFFESFRGDGLCASTPTGSTAYNKSVGGAVMDPKISGFQLTELASLNNRVYRSLGSPIILGTESQVTLRIHDDSDSLLTCDRRVVEWNTDEHHLSEVAYRVADQPIRFAKYRHTSFWDRVHESFIGGRK